MPDLRIRKREASAAKGALIEAYQAIGAGRVNPISWLSLAHRAHHPGSDVGRIATLLAAFAPRYSDIYMRDICQPLILSRADAHDALKALQRAGLLVIRPSLRTEALELTIRIPQSNAEAANLAEERLRA